MKPCRFSLIGPRSRQRPAFTLVLCLRLQLQFYEPAIALLQVHKLDVGPPRRLVLDLARLARLGCTLARVLARHVDEGTFVAERDRVVPHALFDKCERPFQRNERLVVGKMNRKLFEAARIGRTLRFQQFHCDAALSRLDFGKDWLLALQHLPIWCEGLVAERFEFNPYGFFHLLVLLFLTRAAAFRESLRGHLPIDASVSSHCQRILWPALQPGKTPVLLSSL